eukprot:10113-Heterococcus_DN1.PRE.1
MPIVVFALYNVLRAYRSEAQAYEQIGAPSCVRSAVGCKILRSIARWSMYFFCNCERSTFTAAARHCDPASRALLHSKHLVS